MDLYLSSRLIIPSSEIKWRFSRSSGSGGQNVNKIDSKVELIFNVQKSKVLSASDKHLIKLNSKNKFKSGNIIIFAQEERTQLKNRKLALKKLSITLKRLLKPLPKKRIKTLPSKSSKRKRIQEKKRRGEIKKNRGYKSISDNLY